MNKKRICMLLACVVTLCAVLCVLFSLRVWQLSGELPSGMVLLVLLTLVCTVVIWRGIAEMNEK